MTNRNISQTIFVGGVLLLLPSQVWALPLLDVGNVDIVKVPEITLSAKNTESFCLGFSDTKNMINAERKKREDAILEYLKEHENTLAEERNVADAELGEARSKSDQRRNEWYIRLSDQANTDTEKDAFVAFKQSIEKAIEKRRDTVDEVIVAFRNGVDETLEGRRTSMETVKESFQKAVDAAFTQVDADCIAGRTTSEIKKSFQNNLKAAREKLKTDKKQLDKVNQTIETLAQAKKGALEKTKTEFEKNLSDAKVALLAVFQNE